MLKPPVLVCLALAGALASGSALRAWSDDRQTAPAPGAQILVLETAKGVIEIEVYPTDAPKSLAHVMNLIKISFYRGQRFHWVQPGVIQFGDPQSRDMTKLDDWGKGGSGRPIGVAEPSKRPFVRGSVGVAYRTGATPQSADSQIFILRAPNPALNGKYASIGRVSKGLDVVDKIEMRDVIKNVTVKTAAK
jgi:cyclophilin family peptidyl-prolyl cis-trans isomerase